MRRASGGRARSRSPGSARRFRETVRDLDIIATATDAPALIDALLLAAVGRRGRGEGRRRRRRSSRTTASASTCASSRPSRTATCSSTSPARRTTTSRCARRPCGAGSRSPSTAITEVETGEVHAFATEEEVYALPRLRVDPARAARERRRARGGAQRRAADARRARRPARRPAHAHDVVGRQGHARGDGRGARSSEGYDVLRDLRPLAAPARRAARSSRREQIDALNERGAARGS